MFSKLCIASLAAFVAAEDPSATIFLDDSGHAASLWQDEAEFQNGGRRVMQAQTNELEKMLTTHHHASLLQADDALLLQAEVATQKVEALGDTIHLAAEAAQMADGINACNYARAGALEAYAMVNRIVNALGGGVGAMCGCVQGTCYAQPVPETCGYPYEAYKALTSQSDQLWTQVVKTTKKCKIIGDAAVLATLT